MVPDIDLVNKFSFSWMGTHGYPSYKTWSQNWPKLGIPHIWAILNIFSKHSFFWIQWVPMGTHHPIAVKMKICLLIGCLGPSFIFCIFLSDQQEKSLFSDSADPSIFVAKWRSHLFYFIYYCFTSDSSFDCSCRKRADRLAWRGILKMSYQ